MNNFICGYKDLLCSTKQYHLWLMLAWVEIRQRYARSKIGPFWLTLSMGILVTALGIVYGTLFEAKLSEYLPMLAIGYVFWTFISNSINEGCNTYIASGNYLKQIPLNRGVFVLQTLYRNIIILAHNFVIVLVVLIIFQYNIINHLHFFIAGFIILCINLLWMITILSILCARFRDLPQIVVSFLQVIFYITPILFKREMLSKFPLLIDLNPFAHLIEIVRSPLLGETAPMLSWLVCIAMAVIGSAISIWFHGRYRARIPYWV